MQLQLYSAVCCPQGKSSLTINYKSLSLNLKSLDLQSLSLNHKVIKIVEDSTCCKQSVMCDQWRPYIRLPSPSRTTMYEFTVKNCLFFLSSDWGTTGQLCSWVADVHPRRISVVVLDWRCYCQCRSATTSYGCTALLVALVVVSGAILNTHLYLFDK